MSELKSIQIAMLFCARIGNDIHHNLLCARGKCETNSNAFFAPKSNITQFSSPYFSLLRLTSDDISLPQLTSTYFDLLQVTLLRLELGKC